MTKCKVGIIGGSGLYDIKGLKKKEWITVDTPFGAPSDKYLTGEIDGVRIAFLPRHGRRHTLLPSEINYRANIYGMKKLGIENIISVTAVGSLKREIKPLDIVIPHQFVDRTNGARRATFFGEGIVAHIGLAEPVCPVLSNVLYEAANTARACVHEGGTYINMEGPGFSTRAESFLYRSWGMDVIGMTNFCEAKLAREAEICYITMAMVTDYDCWYHGEETVTVEMIVNNLNKNAVLAKNIIGIALSKISLKRNCACGKALENAIITPSDSITPEIKKKLRLIIGKYIK